VADFKSRFIVELSEAEFRKFMASAKQIDDAQKRMGDGAQRASQQTAQGARQSAQGFQQTADSARQATKEIENLNKQADAFAQRGRQPLFLQFALFPAAGLAQRLGAEGLAGGLFAASDVLGIADNALIIRENIGALAERLKEAGGPISAIANTAAGLAAPLGATAASFASVLAVVAPLSIALVGVIALITEINRQAEESAKRVREFVALESGVAEAIGAGATTEDLEQSLSRMQAGRNALAQRSVRLEAFQAYFESLNRALSQTTDPAAIDRIRSQRQNLLQELSEETGGLITNENELRLAIEGLNAELENADKQINAFEQAIVSGAAAENDRRAAMERASETLLATSQREIELQQARERLALATSEQIAKEVASTEARLELLEDEQEKKRALNLVTGEYNDEIAANSLEIVALTNHLDELRKMLTYARNREALATFLNDLIETGRERARIREEHEQAINDIRQRFLDRANTLQENFQEANLIAQEKYYFDLDKLQRDFEAKQEEDLIKAQEKQRDIQNKFNDQREKDRLEHERRLAKIERDFQRDFRSAVAERDALAAHLARIRRDDAIKDEEERYKLLQKTRQDDFDKQQKALQKALEDQRRERERDYNRRRNELRLAFEFEARMRNLKYENDLRQLNAKLQAEINMTNQAFFQELNNLRNHLFSRYVLENQYYTAISNRIANALGSAFNSIPTNFSLSQPAPAFSGGSGGGGGSGISPIRYTRASGGPLVPFADTLVGENGPEVLRLPVRGHVYTMDQYRQMESGKSLVINVPVYGTQMTKRDVKSYAIEAIDEQLTAAGWE